MFNSLKSLFVAASFAIVTGGFFVPTTYAENQIWQPSGPIKMIVAMRAGGGVDTHARLIAEELEARKGWKIIPEQITGKGGLNAVRALKNAPKDGTTIAMIVNESVGYNMRVSKGGSPSDVTPITTTAGAQMGIVALTSKGWKNLDDVVKAFKGGQKIRFGVMSPKLGDLAYVISKQLGIKFNIVTVNGGKAVMNGLNAGDLDIGFGAGIQNKAVNSGDMINLASAINERLKISPEAPLLSKYGVKFTGDVYFMFAGPKNMDPAATKAIATAVNDIVNDSKTKAGQFIKKAFGGPVSIAGKDLLKVINNSWDDSAGLINAAK